ncbi:hypothetical protein AGMMS50296_0830 [Alphaproteobacteria bacterium]|nr:hypothetical protein AGMMS50296_0830 [Alphaproteobacteria bacterium]
MPNYWIEEKAEMVRKYIPATTELGNVRTFLKNFDLDIWEDFYREEYKKITPEEKVELVLQLEETFGIWEAVGELTIDDNGEDLVAEYLKAKLREGCDLSFKRSDESLVSHLFKQGNKKAIALLLNNRSKCDCGTLLDCRSEDVDAFWEKYRFAGFADLVWEVKDPIIKTELACFALSKGPESHSIEPYFDLFKEHANSFQPQYIFEMLRMFAEIAEDDDASAIEKRAAKDALKFFLEERRVNTPVPVLVEEVWVDSPLVVAAARHGSTGLLNFLVALKAKLELKDDEGKTALDWALKNSDQESIDLLISAGAHAENLHPNSILVYASRLACNADVKAETKLEKLRELFEKLEGGVNNPLLTQCLDDEMKNLFPVIAAVRWHNGAFLENLLVLKANFNQKDEAGLDALDWALVENQTESVSLLINEGASTENLNAKSILGWIAYLTRKVALEKGNIRQAITAFLSQYGGINAKFPYNGRDVSPLTYALIRGDSALSKWFVEAGAKLEYGWEGDVYYDRAAPCFDFISISHRDFIESAPINFEELLRCSLRSDLPHLVALCLKKTKVNPFEGDFGCFMELELDWLNLAKAFIEETLTSPGSDIEKVFADFIGQGAEQWIGRRGEFCCSCTRYLRDFFEARRTSDHKLKEEIFKNAFLYWAIAMGSDYPINILEWLLRQGGNVFQQILWTEGTKQWTFQSFFALANERKEPLLKNLLAQYLAFLLNKEETKTPPHVFQEVGAGTRFFSYDPNLSVDTAGLWKTAKERLQAKIAIALEELGAQEVEKEKEKAKESDGNEGE